MLDINRVLKEDRLLRALTGLNRKAFGELSQGFEIILNQEAIAKSQKHRKRAVGGGRKARLQRVEEKLFFILFYFKCYPTFDVAGVLFDLHRSRAHRWMLRLQPLLEKVLGKKMVLPKRKLESIDEFIVRFPYAKEVMIDGTERPIQRPKDQEKQKSHYSGKKKCHTRKHLVMTDQDKRVLVLTKAREGKLHDKRQLNEEKLVDFVPDELPIHVDLGFQGLQKEFVNIKIPDKKPRGKELTEEQKQSNREKSSERVKCEHTISGIKRYKAAATVYRNHIRDLDDRFMLTAAGLWNFYLMAA
ncbi:transposase, IS4 family protein [Stanieria sp. NIES-3757]|nr:transposase, IS4 family protein [Stanieria sp. NIES-3757]BAU64739.1 transposase, IS4 family protein [Stanieria sp. NIES-3757]BAU64940.1 transposase, IS4 family protein [Stanieria sp. NIES-3757]BAU64999.1 transposase, IS4 family protein [Stanieria sp. NIES-3757]